MKKHIYKELQDKFWDLNNLSHHYENFEIKSQIINNDIDINNLIIDNKSQNVVFKVGKSIILLL